MTNLHAHLPRRSLLLVALATICAVLGALAFAHAGSAGAKSARPANAGPRAHAASTYFTGVGDESHEMFTDPNWIQLRTKIARYIVPYDAAVRSYSLDKAKLWIKAAEAKTSSGEYVATFMASLDDMSGPPGPSQFAL